MNFFQQCAAGVVLSLSVFLGALTACGSDKAAPADVAAACTPACLSTTADGPTWCTGRVRFTSQNSPPTCTPSRRPPGRFGEAPSARTASWERAASAWRARTSTASTAIIIYCARQLEGPLVFLRAILGCVVLSLDIYGARAVPVRGTSAFSSPRGRGLRQPALHAFFAEMADFFSAGKADFNQPAAIPTPDLVISRQGKMKFRVTLMAT